MGKLENKFQADLIYELRSEFPDCIIMKNDAGYKQGIPDIMILKGKRWAALECKKEKTAPHQPNQDYYVDKMDKMSYARFIYPENKQEVMDELKVHFRRS